MWLLAVALLVAQALGLMHRIAHVDPERASTALASVSTSASEASGEAGPVVGSPAGWLAALFAGHVGARDCDLFDQMSHADFAVGTMLVPATTMTPADAVAAVHRAWHLAAQAQGFLARAPPIEA